MEADYNFQESKYDKKWIAIFCGTIIVSLLIALFLNASGIANRTEVVSNGYIIIGGKLLKHPYKIMSDGENITVNGEWYDSEDDKSPLLNAWIKSQFRSPQLDNSRFNSLVNFMKRGGLEIIFYKDKGGANIRSSNMGSSKTQEMIENMNNVINSGLPIKEKRKKIIEILDLAEYDYKYIDDFLNNWNS